MSPIRRALAIVACLSAVVLLASLAFRSSTPVAPIGKVKAFVSILPQSYFVERVGGEHVGVQVLVGPGEEPHTFEPTPRQMAALFDADVFFRIGLPFEERIIRKLTAAHGQFTIVDTRKGIRLRPMTASHHTQPERDEGRGELGRRNTGTPDPHIWLDPVLVKIQARTICSTLKRLDPAHAADYEKNLAVFHADLDRAHAEIAESLAPLKGRPILVFHPAFGYFCDAYGLQQRAVEIEGKGPSAKQLAQVIETARRDGAKVIFVQPQFSTKTAEAVAREIGGAVVPVDVLAHDYITNLVEIAQKVRASLDKND